ncbi:hypothetical protein ACV3KS_06195 [Clostridium perfringens]|uniref:hypothetical protein n=1 Tax=Clostridium perfringens TaxID=1502 RepID=UPI0013EF7B42|nr:hypothetical protein [Clostridium perfringens]NGY68390.1 hypothetical protein [Clostridium perfringens]
MNLETFKTLGPTIVGVVSIGVSLIINSRILKSKLRDDELKEINSKLNEFYGPFIQLKEKSKILYGLFTKGKEDEFRTLVALLKGEKFSGNDEKLLNEIVEIDKELENLIVNKGGYIENDYLRELFAKASAHFNIMQQAYNKVLIGEVERFKEYIYPRELDNEIKNEVNRLNSRIKELNSCWILRLLYRIKRCFKSYFKFKIDICNNINERIV